MSMRKILRMFLVCFMTMFCGTVMADEAKFDFTTKDGLVAMGIAEASIPTVEASASEGQAFETTGPFTVNGISISASNGGTTNTRIWSPKGNDGTKYDLRVYGADETKGTVTISAPAGKNITKIEFTTGTWNAPTVNVGTLDSKVWTGDANSVIFTQTKQCQYKTVIVTFGEGGGSTVTVSTPTISGTTPFTENTEVTISGTPEGGKTYYTTDGSDPTSSSTLYSTPFTLTETTTVKAISYDKDNNASSVASKTFEKEEIATANTIAELLAMESGKTANLKLNNAVVLYAGKNDIIIKDATGGIDFYQTGLSLTAGQILNGSIIIERSDYNNFKEVKKTNNTNLDNVTITDGTVTPTVSTVANVAASEDCADLYKLEKVEVVANGTNYDIVDGETTIRLYDQFKLNFTKAAGKFNLVGVIGNFKGTKQFWPTEAPESTEEVTIGEASDISEFIGIEEKGKPYKLTLENAQVVYSWTSTNGNIQAFVRDETGALCFDFRNDFKTVGTAFVTNKMVNGTIIMNNNVYNGLPQASAIAETNTEKLTFTDGSEAQPLKITAADVSKNINDLVLLENVTIEEKEGKYYVGDVQLYNQFHIEGFNDLSSFVGEGKNVKGIAVVYNTTYEIYPIEITSQGGGETPATSGVMIKFTEEDVCAKGAAKSEYANGDFKLTCVDTKAEKLEIDANNAYFGTAEDYQKFTHRLKTGGKSGSSNSLTLTIPSDGTLKVYVRTGKNGETDRNLVLTQDGTELYNKVVQEADAVQVDMGGEEPTNVYPVISVAVKAGEVTIGYPVNSLNFYAFEFIAGSSGIQNVVKPVVENGIRYNLAGQRVDENYKGVVIMNGKKFIVK